MAEVSKNGILVNPSTGSGNTTLKVKANPANPGNRVKQSQVFTVTAPGVDTPSKFTANLLPKAEFVQFDEETMAVKKEGGTVTITGVSNSAMLTFTKGSGEIIAADIVAVEYEANGDPATSGVAIDGDPGAKAQYVFTLQLTAAANETVEERSQVITVTGQGGSSIVDTITLNQTAGDPTLEVSPASIDVPQDGSEVNVTVTTNTTFTVTAD